MTGQLYPTLAFHDDESPVSFVSRLARFHGIPSARMFCSDLGLNFRRIVNGDRKTLATLSYLSGASLSTLLSNAVQSHGGNWRIGQEQLLKSSLIRGAPRVCLSCLTEDAAASDLSADIAIYGRTRWLISHIRSCSRHGIALVTAARPGHSSETHDFSMILGACAPELALLARKVTPLDASRLESYLLTRLNAVTGGSPWLDQLEFSAAARTCELIGAVANHGRKAKLATLSDKEWHSAGDTGFEIASQGESAIRAWLTDLQAVYSYNRTANEGGQATFGKFYEWLALSAKDACFDPVKNLVRRHIVETTPVGLNDIVFGKSVEKRMLHSVFTASKEFKAHPKRLRKIFVATGLVSNDPSKTNNQVLVDADAAQKLFDDGIINGLSIAEVTTYLNASRLQARLLVHTGLIRSAVGGKEGIGAYAFTKSDLDDFLARLLEQTVEVTEPDESVCSIPMAAKRSRCSAIEIVRLILDKRLSWVGKLAGETGYQSILVSAAEIRGHVRGPAVDGITAR